MNFDPEKFVKANGKWLVIAAIVAIIVGHVNPWPQYGVVPLAAGIAAFFAARALWK